MRLARFRFAAEPEADDNPALAALERSLFRTLRLAPEATPPAWFTEQVMRQVRDRSRVSELERRLAPILAPFFAAGALAASALLMYLYWADGLLGQAALAAHIEPQGLFSALRFLTL